MVAASPKDKIYSNFFHFFNNAFFVNTESQSFDRRSTSGDTNNAGKRKSTFYTQ